MKFKLYFSKDDSLRRDLSLITATEEIRNRLEKLSEHEELTIRIMREE